MKPTTKNGSKVEMSVYVGIDIHKRFCQAALMDEQGLILEELKFENNLEGVHSLVNLARCETYKSSSLVGSVGFEPTTSRNGRHLRFLPLHVLTSLLVLAQWTTLKPS